MTKSNDTSLWTSQIDRRSLLRTAGFGALAVAGTGLLLPACASDGQSDPDGQGETELPTGGTFVAAVASDPSPAAESVYHTAPAIIGQYFAERLYRTNWYSMQDVVPELAVALPEQVDPTTYRVALREGVTFHDGRSFTAADVVFTFQHWVRDPESGFRYADYLSIIDEIRPISDYEVEFALTVPTSLLLSRLLFVAIRPDKATQTFGFEPIGTGPYRVASVASGERFIMERYEDYVGERDLTYDTLEFHSVSDSNARVAGLLTGQFDMMEEVPASAFEQVSSANGIQAEAVDTIKWTAFEFNCGRAPFNDTRVRQAVMYAIDRDAITESSYFGHAKPAWTGFLPPEHPGFIEPQTVYSYDPDESRRLLAEAGITMPVAIELLFPGDDSGVVSQVPVIEQNLRDVGFEPNLVPLQGAAKYTPMIAGDFDLGVSGPVDWSQSGATADFLLRASFTGYVATNVVHWANDEAGNVERLLDELDTAPDEAARQDLLAQAQNIVQQEVPFGAIHFVEQLTAWSDSLQGFAPLPSGGVILDGVRG